MDLEKVMSYIGTIEHCLSLIKEEVSTTRPRIRVTTSHDSPNVKVRVNNEVVQSRGESKPVAIPNQTVEMARKIIKDDAYPCAVPEDLLCNVSSDDDKMYRAENILDSAISTNLKGVKFLDYGCGNGFVAERAVYREAEESWGYDIDPSPEWNGHNSAKFVSHRGQLKKNYFDVILLYDVIDHCQNPSEVLSHCEELLAPGGVIYARCHPWCSRTGGHLYQKINKAYIHLAIDPEILSSMGYEVPPIKKILRPMKTYRDYFQRCGLRIFAEQVQRDQIEAFFMKEENREYADLIMRHWDSERGRDKSLTRDVIIDILKVHFVDYALKSIKK